jgi:hypothetical protein
MLALDLPISYFRACCCVFPSSHSVRSKQTARTDTNRIMVTVTISFSAPDRATSTDFKSQVITSVKSAISAGKFTKLEL